MLRSKNLKVIFITPQQHGRCMYFESIRVHVSVFLLRTCIHIGGVQQELVTCTIECTEYTVTALANSRGRGAYVARGKSAGWVFSNYLHAGVRPPHAQHIHYTFLTSLYMKRGM